MPRRKVLDFTSASGACGDFTVLLDSIAEQFEPGDIVEIRIPEEFAWEVREAVETLSDTYELVKESKSDGVVVFELKRK